MAKLKRAAWHGSLPLIGMLLFIWGGCRKEASPPQDAPAPVPPSVNMGVGDTTGMMINVIDSVFTCAHNVWAVHQLPVPGAGAPAIVLEMRFSTSLLTSSSAFRLSSAPPGDIVFNGRFAVDTTYMHADSVLQWMGNFDPPFYRNHVTYTHGCGVDGEVHAVTERTYPNFHPPGAAMDGLPYDVTGLISLYSSGNSYNAPGMETVNDSTRRMRTWVYLNDCYPPLPMGEDVHVAFVRSIDGELKHGWLSMRRESNTELRAGVVAIEP